MAFVAEGSGYLELEEVGELGELFFLDLVTRYEPFGSGSRCFDSLETDHIEDADIACVPNAGEDRQGELGAEGTEFVVVETGEVGIGAAATDDDYEVKGGVRGVDFVECRHDGERRGFALHSGREELREEGVTTLTELIGKILVSRSISCTDNGYPAYQCGQREGRLQFHHSLFLEPRNGLSTLAHEATQGELGIDTHNHQRKAVHWVKIDVYIQFDLHTGLQLHTRGVEEISGKHRPDIGPTGSTNFGDNIRRGAQFGRRRFVVAFLNEFHETMPSCFGGEGANLGCDAVGGVEVGLYGSADGVAEFV